MLVLAIQVSVLICAIVTVFIPAMGEYAYLKINLPLEFPGLPSVATSYVAPVAEIVQLRTSAPRVQLDHLMGVITFPSFHAAAALLFIWGLWRVAVVRWLSLFLNGIMLVATPVFGGHYFADVAAGLLVATLSIWIAHGTVHFFQKKERGVSVASKTEVAVEQLAN
jgi:membrane-associated phospholipid phosphatase